VKKKLKMLQYVLFIFCFTVGTVLAQDEKVFSEQSIDEMLNDPRYDSAFKIVGEQNLFLDTNSSVPKETKDGLAVLVPIIDTLNENKGVLSIHQGIWNLSMEVSGEMIAFELVMDGQTVTPIKLNPRNHHEEGGFEKMIFNDDESSALTKVYMIGNDWCMYTSKLSIHYSCWSPDGNPFAYYFVVKYRKGDTISSHHYTWRNDYKGRGIACPLNEYNVFSMPQCGFPPD